MNGIIRLDPREPGRPHSTVPVLPGPRMADISIRPGVLDDFAFIDALQKQHSRAVGFMFAGAIKGHLSKGNVLVAEAGGDGCLVSGVGAEDSGYARTTGGTPIPPQGLAPTPNTQDPTPTPVGYLIAVDRYLKRDELGIIYQMNVVPAYQRSLVAANLLKAQFDRSAYGCRLYCCWCAQDLAANKFWEAMGFVPLAFRTGGGRRKKEGPRMHIFWQKRIRPSDDFPYWFPSQTGAGAIGEDRLVLPIPPGTHWSDAKPVVLPESSRGNEEVLLLEERVSELEKTKKGLKKKACGMGRNANKAKKVSRVKAVAAGGLHFGPRKLTEAEAEAEKVAAEAKAKQDEAAAIDAELKEAKRKAKRAKKKFDPAQEAFARELKDRWLEEVVARPGLLAPAAAPGTVRYDVTRGIQATTSESVSLNNVERLQLPDAA